MKGYTVTKLKSTCMIEDCESSVKTRGYCNKHYLRWWNGKDIYKDPPKAIKGECLVEGCKSLTFNRGYCIAHHHRLLRYGSPTGKPQPHEKTPKLPCKLEGCDSPRHGNHLCKKHYERYNKWGNPTRTGAPSRDMSIRERLFSKIFKSGELPEHNPSLGECWLYLGCQGISGYGVFWYEGKNVSAHVISYRLEVGSIPLGYEIDHLCKNTSCIRPEHLEAVIPYTNRMRSGSFAGTNHRKTHCTHGHPLSGDNLYIDPKGKRRCRTCDRRRLQKRRKELKEVGITERQITSWNKDWQRKLDAIDVSMPWDKAD